jgi:DNA-directed RNA polymerase subunit RPC12/RpoP
MAELKGREIGQGQRVVSASMLPEQITECPQCGSKVFIMHGVFERPFDQLFEDGKPKEDGLALGAQTIQNIEAIECQACNILTIVEDDAAYERESMIFDLIQQVATLQGRSVVVPTKEWKN